MSRLQMLEWVCELYESCTDDIIRTPEQHADFARHMLGGGPNEIEPGDVETVVRLFLACYPILDERTIY